jgi:hypothetical protein
MTPTPENIHTFVAISFGVAIFLSGLLFIVQKISRRKIKWGGFIVFALAAYGLPIVGFASKYVGDRKSWRNEATTSGIVVAHDPPNHNQYEFEYAIASQRYYSWHQGTVTCDAGELNIGKTVLERVTKPSQDSRATLKPGAPWLTSGLPTRTKPLARQTLRVLDSASHAST